MDSCRGRITMDWKNKKKEKEKEKKKKKEKRKVYKCYILIVELQ